MRRWGVLLLLLFLLPGCASVAREPDDLALVRVLGVDGANPVKLTAVCGKTGQGDVTRGGGEGISFPAARKEVPWSGGGEELSLTGVSYLVVGPDADLAAVLFAVLEDAELGASATVWLAPEGADVLLDSCANPEADLRLLTLKGVAAPTVAQAAAALATEGEVALPRLGGQNGRLKERGSLTWSRNN